MIQINRRREEMSREKKAESGIAEIIERRRNRLTDRQNWRSLLMRIAILAVAGYVLLTQVFLITRFCGENMFPSFKDGDLVIGFRFQLDALAKKDVVVYLMNGEQLVGRVVAKSGDVVDISEDGVLIINGTVQNEEIMYPTYAGEELSYPCKVPENSLFVLGDYRTRTKDSRNFGAVPLEAVEAKVITILRRRGL